MISTESALFEIGDVVRVRTAQRRDAFFTVAEATYDRVRAVNDRGGEAIYSPDAFELVRQAKPKAVDDHAGTGAPTLRQWDGLEPVKPAPTAQRPLPTAHVAKFMPSDRDPENRSRA